jgi:hypothetical protein
VGLRCALRWAASGFCCSITLLFVQHRRQLGDVDGDAPGSSVLATELEGRRQEILIEAVPGIRRMAAIADTNTIAAAHLQALQYAARARAVELSIHRITRPEEIPAAIDAAKASDAAALNVLESPIFYGNRQIIMQSVAALRLPAIYSFPEEAEEGGFAAYGPRLFHMYELVAPALRLRTQGVRENRTEPSLVRPAFRWLILLQSVHTTKLFAKTRKWRLLPPSEIITT